jgi:hypothetical protein
MTALIFEGELDFPDYPTDLLFVKRFILRPDGTLAFHMVAQHVDGNLEVSGTTKPADELYGWKTATTANFVGSKRSFDVDIIISHAMVAPDGSHCSVRGVWHGKGSGEKWKFEGILDPYRAN